MNLAEELKDWKLVPRQENKAMREAFWEGFSTSDPSTFSAGYRNMLGNTPKEPNLEKVLVAAIDDHIKKATKDKIELPTGYTLLPLEIDKGVERALLFAMRNRDGVDAALIEEMYEAVVTVMFGRTYFKIDENTEMMDPPHARAI